MTAGPFLQQGINYYVPQMQQAPGVGDDGIYAVGLGAPILGGPTSIMAAANGAFTNGAAKTFNAALLPAIYPFVIDAPYGRAVILTGATAGDNVACIVRGVDYLGQPMAETITLSGGTQVQGNKAFKRVDSVFVPAGNANANSSLNVGLSGKLGLPWKTQQVLGEYANDILAAAGTLVQPVLTDPATLVTGDPRGLYTPSTTLNGVNSITLAARTSRFVNPGNNGGLHGIRHFFS